MSTNPLTVAVIEATEVAEDLITLWRECRRIEHRLRYLRLQFEYDFFAVDPDAQDEIAREVSDWKRLVKAFAESRRASAAAAPRPTVESRRAA